MKLCQETLRPLAGGVKASSGARHAGEAGGVGVGTNQQQPQTVSRTLGKTSLEINELALRARRPIAIAGPRCRGNLQSLAFHLRGVGCQGHPSTPRVRVCWYVPPRGPSRAQVNAADRGLRASTMAGFEPSGNLRDWQTAAPRIESIFAVKLCQETLRPLAGGVKASSGARHAGEAGGVGVGTNQQQPQTVSRTLGKTSLEINGLALRARRPIAIVGPKMPGNRQGLPPPQAPTPRRTPVV